MVGAKKGKSAVSVEKNSHFLPDAFYFLNDASVDILRDRFMKV